MNDLLVKVEALLEKGDDFDIIANLANVSALLFEEFDEINWLGFYLMHNGSLIVGPFEGKIACRRIEVGKGVCGTSVKERRTILVEDVHQFEGHIACDSASNSELVVPIFKNNEVFGVLDIDSPKFARFTKEDAILFEQVVQVIEKYI